MDKQMKMKYMLLIEEKLKLLPWYVVEFIDSRKRKLSLTTLLNYCHDYIIFFDWLVSEGFATCNRNEIGLDVLESLTIRNAESFLSFLEYQLNNSKSTVNRKLSSLKSLFGYLQNKAETEDLKPYLNRNVMAKLELNATLENPKNTARRISGKILRDDEFELFRQFIAHGYGDKIKKNLKLYNAHLFNRERDTAIISLILGSGLRLSEVVGCNIDDIDISQKLVRVVRKGGKEQYVYFSEQSLIDLKEYLSIRAERYKLSDSEQSLFVSSLVGRPGMSKRLTQRSIQKMVDKYAVLYGKPALNVHALRHSFATRYHALNNDVPKLKDQLGHSSIQTTMIYTHLTDEDMRAALDKMDKREMLNKADSRIGN